MCKFLICKIILLLCFFFFFFNIASLELSSFVCNLCNFDDFIMFMYFSSTVLAARGPSYVELGENFGLTFLSDTQRYISQSLLSEIFCFLAFD